MRRWSSTVPLLICIPILLAVAAGCASSSDPPPDQIGFASSQAAVTALVDALRRGDDARLRQILGPHGQDILSSGDPVADRGDVERFLALYDERHSLQADNDGVETLVAGNDGWPFPVPLFKSGRDYFFDTETGREEVLNRRIGRNELSAEQVCLAIVDAQMDYVRLSPMGGDLPEYAQKIVSDRGTKNGLYWPTTGGEPPSPLGPLIASAAAEGYGAAATESASRPAPPAYHGYRYRLLTAQGPHAPGGALDYLVNNRLIGGFGVIAYPAQYANSGIMTFIASHGGAVYQRDLGPETERIASQMNTFDPGPEWTRLGDAPPVAQSR